jgi:glycosyltransferase involved in cell wall biosynthesis
MNRPLRVLHYIDTENFAGTERHILELSSALEKQGVETRIACPSASILASKAREQNIKVLCIEGSGAFNRGAVRTLRRLLREGTIDIVHAHNGRTALSCASAVKLARRGRCIATQHFIDPARTGRSGPKALLFNQVHHLVNSGVDHFIANSQAARDAMLQRGDAPNEKITVTPLGISLPDTSQLKTPSHVREQFAVAPTAPLVVCVARLEREKDVGTLVAAMKIVVQEQPDTICLHAGEGAEKEAIEEQIRAAKLEDSVVLLGFQSDVLSLIGAADVFVLPSLAEPFGLVLLEAMAMRKPVIATCAGGPQEIVEPEETGLLVTPSQSSEMAQAILRLLQNTALREKVGEKGYARFQERFTTKRMAQSTLEVYHRVL